MPAREKLDLYKEHKAEYATPKTPVLVDASPAKYLTIEGQGPPGGDAFQAKLAGLYGVAFTIKMTRKFAGLGDYKVCHLEGLWWADRRQGMRFTELPPEKWQWKLLIRTPDFVSGVDLESAKQALRDKGKPPQFTEVELETLDEGRCVQVLHIGPYTDEEKTVNAMFRFAKEKGLVFDGRHHEIYLSDPRRVAPAKLRTILRHPVRPE